MTRGAHATEKERAGESGRAVDVGRVSEHESLAQLEAHRGHRMSAVVDVERGQRAGRDRRLEVLAQLVRAGREDGVAELLADGLGVARDEREGLRVLDDEGEV